MKGRKSKCRVFAMVLALAVILASDFSRVTYVMASEGTYQVQVTGNYGQTEARTMLDMVNQFRTGNEAWCWDEKDEKQVYANGLSALTYDYGLEKIAMQRAMELVLFYDHARPNGDENLFAQFSQVNGENIAIGHGMMKTAKDAFEAWQETNEPYVKQGHRRNMLSPNFTTIGVGYVHIGEYYFWVQEFGISNTGTAETEANDSQTTVDVDVAPSLIQEQSIEYENKDILIPNGSKVNVPDIQAKITMTLTWESGIRPVPVSVPHTWQIASGNDKISIEDGKIVGKQMGDASISTSILGKTITIPVKVVENDFESAKVKLTPESFEYDGKEQTPEVTVELGEDTLNPDTDYTVSYENNTDAGTATVCVQGNGDYTGTAYAYFEIRPRSMSDHMSEFQIGSIPAQDYTGEALTPEVTVSWGTDPSERLERDKDYTVEYADNQEAGNAKVTVKGKGNFTGELTGSFQIKATDPVDPSNPTDTPTDPGGPSNPSAPSNPSTSDNQGTDASKPTGETENGTSDVAKPKVKKGEKKTDSIGTYRVTSVPASGAPSVEFKAAANAKKTVLSIPETVKINGVKCQVVSIAKNACKGNKKLKKVTIPSSVTTIGASAFQGCASLTTVKIGGKVSSIGNKAFYKCAKLSKATIPAKVNKIGSGAFAGCKHLKSITIKTTKLTKKNVSSKAFSGIHSNAKIKVPAKKLKAYKALFKSKGIGKKVKVVK